MNEFRYPIDALTGDYVRAAAGVLICGGPLPFLGANLPALLILGSLTALFAYFGWRTYLRQRTIVHVDEESIETTGLIRNRLEWRNLEQVKLSYFSTRRDRRNGWMQLSVKGSDGGLRLDSNIDGFETLARLAYDAAMTNGLEMTPATHGNFHALGIHHEAPADGWGDPSAWGEKAESG